ncbi:MAG: hypothetical protein ABUJ92_00720 [Desulfobacterales bacterium]
MARKKFPLRVVKGGFQPASQTAIDELKERGYKIGDMVFADFSKPRNPGFHRLVHALGKLCSENLDAFEGVEAHKVLKRLQVEGNIECDEVALNFPGVGPCVYRIPRSLSYESMSQDQFKLAYMGFCRHIAKVYYPTLTADQVDEMAELMADEHGSLG